jgi:anti-anti-sigma factor
VEKPETPERFGNELFGLEIVATDEQITVRLRGELDLSSRSTFDRALARLADERSRVVVFDLSALEFVEAHAVAQWHDVGLQLRERGSRLVLHHARPVVERLITIVDLDGAVEVVRAPTHLND